MLPEQLRDYKFNFVKLSGRTKIPVEKEWQKKKYNFEEIYDWFKLGNNYSVMCGVNDLIVIDTDDNNGALTEVMMADMPETFTVKTSRGFHFYYLSSTRKKKIVFMENGVHFGELISCGGQVTGPLCTHKKGNVYTIERDVPIYRIT